MLNSDYQIKEIAEIVQGTFYPGSAKHTRVRDILIDSRRLISPSRCVFFALQSKRNNGHNYIEELYNKGIRHFVVSKMPENKDQFEKANFILVKNTLVALQKLAAGHRKKFDIPVIGITGSNGKTIVKEWLYQLMNFNKNIIRSPKSYNSQIGVPLSVWQMNENHELGIFEAGISEPDEMEKLQAIIQPGIGVFTNIGNAHDENFINLQQKAGEKLKLFTKVETIIYCADHPEIQGVIIRSGILNRIKSFTWSYKGNANLNIRSLEKQKGTTQIKAHFEEKDLQIKIPFIDGASVENAIHCWAVMLYLGYDQKVIAKRMMQLTPIAMRLELKEGINNCSVINDSYNSDINSLGIALDFLQQQKQHHKKTVILSDLLQSGQNELNLYGHIAELLESKGVQKLIGIGNSIGKNSERFSMEKYFYPSTEEFLNTFPFTSFNNETILLKGARIFEFEQISQALQQKAHETVLEINLNSLINNLNYFRNKLKKPETKVMAMVKAFSYGSGSFEIANALQFHHIDYLTVAYADEGVELRKAGINAPIMVMNPDWQSFDSIIKHNLEPEIYSFRILDLLEKSIKENIIPANKPVKIHIKLDTGMHRLGFEEPDLDKLIDRLKQNRSIYLQSVFSHLAGSQDKAYDDFSKLQIERFKRMSEKIVSFADDHSVLRHILNSAGINRFPEAQFDMVRLGIGMYGISSDVKEQKELENVSTLKSTISQIKTIQPNETIGYNRSAKANKEMKIAIVPLGYADGLNMNFGLGKGKLWVNGDFAPIVGNICMDMCIIDITDIKAKEGDEVIVFGEKYPISEMAASINTIPYEILTGISRRVKRVYFQE